MTTTISYHGSTIATIENQTKTLTTAGTYVPYSFIVTDATSGGSGFTADTIAMRTISGDISGNATAIGSNAFRECSALTTVSFPNATIIGSYAFGKCSSLTTVSFPSATSIGSSAFDSCHSLTTASFPNVTNIGSSAFRDCYNLLSFYLLGSSVPTLDSNVFFSTPIGGYTTSTGGVYGSVYVPASLYSSYLTATNWSSIAARIVSVSDSSSSSIPDTLVAKFVKRWYDTGSTASCSVTSHYTTLPNLPLVLGNPVTHLTYQIITDSAFSVQLNGTTSPMGEGPHIYLSSAAPTDIDSMGTCIYSHADDGMDFANVSEAFSVAAGNNGKYLTIHTWCDDWDNETYTEATVSVSLYGGEYYLLKK